MTQQQKEFTDLYTSLLNPIYEKKFKEDTKNLLDNWISVEDELPKETDTGGYVLIYSDKIRVAFFEPIYSQFIVDAIGVLENVTHWQEIQPPKQSTKKRGGCNKTC